MAAARDWLERHYRFDERDVEDLAGAFAAIRAPLLAAKADLQTWKDQQQAALISMAATLLEAGYRGPGIPDGVAWLLAAKAEHTEVLAGYSREIQRLNDVRDDLCKRLAEAEALAEERAGLLTTTVELAQRYLDERNAARKVADALAEAGKACVELLGQVAQRRDFVTLEKGARELTDAELGRLWISVGAQLEAALALHAKLKESEKPSG